MKHVIVRICWPYKSIWKWCKLFQGLLKCHVVNQTWFRQIWLLVIFRRTVRSPGTKHSVPRWEGLWGWLHWLDRAWNCLSPFSGGICHTRRLWHLKDHQLSLLMTETVEESRGRFHSGTGGKVTKMSGSFKTFGESLPFPAFSFPSYEMRGLE